jgi:hypothetical protein
MLDSLPDMAVLARVVDVGSFSGAAGQFGITPSAVSRQVVHPLMEIAHLACTANRFLAAKLHV